MDNPLLQSQRLSTEAGDQELASDSMLLGVSLEGEIRSEVASVVELFRLDKDFPAFGHGAVNVLDGLGGGRMRVRLVRCVQRVLCDYMYVIIMFPWELSRTCTL